jgi:hypothetical protein
MYSGFNKNLFLLEILYGSEGYSFVGLVNSKNPLSSKE